MDFTAPRTFRRYPGSPRSSALKKDGPFPSRLGRISFSRMSAIRRSSRSSCRAGSSRWRIPAVAPGGSGSSRRLPSRSRQRNAAAPDGVENRPRQLEERPEGLDAGRVPRSRPPRDSPARRDDRTSRRRGGGYGQVDAAVDGLPEQDVRGRRRMSTVSISPTGRSSISRSARVEISFPSPRSRATTRPAAATLRRPPPRERRRTSIPRQVQRDHRSRRSANASKNNTTLMGKAYGYRAGGLATGFSGYVRSVAGRRRRPSSPAIRRPSIRYVPAFSAARISSIRRGGPRTAQSTARPVSSNRCPTSRYRKPLTYQGLSTFCLLLPIRTARQ